MPRRRSDVMRAIDAVQPLVDQFNELEDGDKLTFLDLVDPLPDGHAHKPKKKAAKKSSTKSPRAQSLSGVIQRTPKVRAADDNEDNEDDNRCTYQLGEDPGGPIICDATLDNNVHHKTSDPDYHPFQPPASTAVRPSSANSGTGNGTASSGTQPENVSPVAREASGGD